jgi:hypothetical protein
MGPSLDHSGWPNHTCTRVRLLEAAESWAPCWDILTVYLPEFINSSSRNSTASQKVSGDCWAKTSAGRLGFNALAKAVRTGQQNPITLGCPEGILLMMSVLLLSSGKSSGKGNIPDAPHPCIYPGCTILVETQDSRIWIWPVGSLILSVLGFI